MRGLSRCDAFGNATMNFNAEAQRGCERDAEGQFERTNRCAMADASLCEPLHFSPRLCVKKSRLELNRFGSGLA